MRRIWSLSDAPRSSTLAVVDSSELTYRDDVQEFAAEIIELVLPSGTGYTVRTYAEPETVGTPDGAAFLGHAGHLLLFRTPAGLARFLASDADHDLRGLPGWSDRAADLVPPALLAAAESAAAADAVAAEKAAAAAEKAAAEAAAVSDETADPAEAAAVSDATADPDETAAVTDATAAASDAEAASAATEDPADAGSASSDADPEPVEATRSTPAGPAAVEVPEESDAVRRYEFDLVPTNLGGSPDAWIPELLLPTRNLTVELATALDLRRIRAALAEGEYLDRFDDALRAAAAAGTFSLARRRLKAFDSARLASQWRQIIRWLEQSVQWGD